MSWAIKQQDSTEFNKQKFLYGVIRKMRKAIFGLYLPPLVTRFPHFAHVLR